MKIRLGVERSYSTLGEVLGSQVQGGFKVWIVRSTKVSRSGLSGSERVQDLFRQIHGRANPVLAMVLLQGQGKAGTSGLLMSLPTQTKGKMLCEKLKMYVSISLVACSLPLSGKQAGKGWSLPPSTSTARKGV